MRRHLWRTTATATVAVMVMTVLSGGRIHADPVLADPASGRLAYVADSQIRTIRTNAGDDRLLRAPADDTETYRRPAYSPDGRHIAYVAESGTGSQVWIADVDGETPDIPVPLPAPLTGQRYESPVFSPDGRYLAVNFLRTVYYPGASARYSSIFVIDLDTDEYTEFESTPVTIDGDTYQTSDSEPTWSPDGSRLAFTRELAPVDISIGFRPLATPGTSQIYAVDFAFPFTGSQPVDQLTDNDCGVEICAVQDRSPTWSPTDVETLVFVRNGTQLRYINPQTEQTGQLFPMGTLLNMTRPAWSPNGAELAVAGDQLGEGPGIWTLEPSPGESAEPELFLGGALIHPSYQPFADLAVHLEPAVADIAFGQSTTVRIFAGNLGPVPTDAVLEFELSEHLSLEGYRSPDTGCSLVADRGVCELDSLAERGFRWVEVDVTAIAPGAADLTASVSGQAVDTDAVNSRARIPITVNDTGTIGIVVRTDPQPAYLDGEPIMVEFIVRNGRSSPLRNVALTALLPPLTVVAVDPPGCAADSPCRLADLNPGQQRTVVYRLAPDAELSETAVGTASGSTGSPTAAPTELTATDSARITVVAPTLRLNPAVGPPGKVTTAIGEGFPPGSRVTLAWDTGIPHRGMTVTVAADGRFRVAVLVFDKDWLGTRFLIAAPAAGRAFGEVKAGYLVVADVQGPPFIDRG